MKKLDFKVTFILINETFDLKRLFAYKERQNNLRRSSVAYCITCTCKSTYIDQTSRNLTIRLKNHDFTLPNEQDIDISKHFTDNLDHKIDSDQPKVMAQTNHWRKLDGSLPANPVNDRRIANAVTLKSTFCLS